MSRRRRQVPTRIKLGIARTNWIFGISYSLKGIRGLNAERKIIEYLQELKALQEEEGSFRLAGGRVIREVVPTMHFSDEDYAAVDVFVKLGIPGLATEETLPVQIKNSYRQREERELEARGICLIVAKAQEDKRRALRRIAYHLSRFIESRNSNGKNAVIASEASSG